MDAVRRLPQIYLAALGVGLAALWPLTAYALNPMLLPAMLIVGLAIVVVLRWPEWGLAIAIALTPLLRVQLPQASSAGLALPGEPLRFLVPLMIFGVLAYGAVVYGVDTRRLPGITAAIGLLILTAVISAFHAIDPSRAVPDVFLLITGAAAFLAVCNICRTRNQLLIVLAGALAALLIASVQGVVQHFVGDFSTQGFVANGETTGRVQGAFGHPNEYAGFLALLMPLAFTITFTKGLPGWLRRLAGLAAAASVPAMVYSYARAALVTLVIGSVIWLLLLRPKRGLQLAAICALAAIALAPTTLQERLNPNNTASDVPLRTDIGASALRIYDQHEFLGVGLNNFQLAYADLSIQEAGAQKRLLHDTQLLVPTAAPSQYLNTLVEQGLLGVVALGLFLLLALATGFRAARSKIPAVSSLGLGLGAGVFSLIIYSFLEISLQESQLIPLFVLLAAASVAESSYRPEVPARGRRGLDLPRPAPRAALGRPVAQR